MMDNERNNLTCEVVAEAARALGRSSYPTIHALGMIEDLADALDYQAEVILLPNSVMVENREGGSVAIRKVSGSYRFDQIQVTQSTVADLSAGLITLESARTTFTGISALKSPVSPVLRVVGYALAATGFAAYLNMRPISIAAAAVLGALAGLAVVLVAEYRPRLTMLMPILVSFGAAILISLGARFLDTPDPVRLGAIAAVLLLPGAALTSAVVELVGGDMVSGASRFLFALMQLAAMSFGFVLGIQVTGVSTSQLNDFTAWGPVWLPWLGLLLFAVGVMLYSCTPRGFWMATLFVIGLTYASLELVQVFAPSYLAAGVASAVALLASWLINNRRAQGPMAIALFLPAFWLLVPGSMAFVAIAGVIDADASLANLTLSLGLNLLTISMGIMVISLIYPYRKQAMTSPV